MPLAAPALSVVIPTWNRCAVVAGAVESALAQAGVDVEVLVVDDGSTDGTAEVLRARFGSDPRVRVLEQPNGGTARARNTGIAAARAPWIGLLDSDDRWEPGFARARLQALAAEPAADLAYGDAAYVGGDGRVLATYLRRIHGHPPLSLEGMLAGGWALPSCMVFRASVLQALRFDPAWRFEDTELLFRFFAAGHRAVFSPGALTRYAAEDDAAAAPRKMAAEQRAKEEQTRLMEAYAARAPDPRAHALRLARRRTLLLAREGQYRAARPHARAWWGGAPLQLRAPWILLRGLLSRR